MSIVTMIDSQLLQNMSIINNYIILELRKNINISLTMNNFTNTFSAIISKDSIKERRKAIELIEERLFQLSKGIQG